MTKAQRDETIKCLTRLLGQARLNAGDAESRSWTAEAEAWKSIARFLLGAAWFVRVHGGLPVQEELPFATGDVTG